MRRLQLLIIIATFIGYGPTLGGTLVNFQTSLVESRCISSAIWRGRVPVCPRS
jgi:hypothetical protein